MPFLKTDITFQRPLSYFTKTGFTFQKTSIAFKKQKKNRYRISNNRYHISNNRYHISKDRRRTFTHFVVEKARNRKTWEVLKICLDIGSSKILKCHFTKEVSL